jgi:hypothetical protein
MNWTVPTGFGLFLIGAVIGLAQLWLRLWEPETFVKLMITVGVLLAIVIVWNLVVREKRESAKIRDSKNLG